MKSIIKAVNLWAKGRLFTEIKQDVNITGPVFVRLQKFLIGKIIQNYEKNPLRLDGANVIIQIDETKLNHNVKSHRGKCPKLPSWTLCIVDISTQPATGFPTLIPDRQTKTLIPIIERVVRPGSIIHTDEAQVYQRLDKSEIGYAHETVCHKYYFKHF